jgi:hypothetical protein
MAVSRSGILEIDDQPAHVLNLSLEFLLGPNLFLDPVHSPRVGEVPRRTPPLAPPPRSKAEIAPGD